MLFTDGWQGGSSSMQGAGSIKLPTYGRSDFQPTLPPLLRFVSSISTSTILFITTLLLCHKVSAAPAPIVTSDCKYNLCQAGKYEEGSKFVVQVVALPCAATSMVASVITFCWFCRMEKRFRHRLIMFLVFGDATKAIWLFLFALVSITKGAINSASSFCQASGFMYQYGTETSDYAVLMISIHSALQVFKPSTTTRSGGLHPFRHWVYFGAFLFPILMSTLAFINPQRPYVAQGPFCMLPVRPFWYRLALSWIPRYLIAMAILGLAAAIYTHVGFELRDFARAGQGCSNSVSMSSTLPSPGLMENPPVAIQAAGPRTRPKLDRRSSSVAHEIVSSGTSRAPGATAISIAGTIASRPDVPQRTTRSQSLPTSRRVSRALSSATANRRLTLLPSALSRNSHDHKRTSRDLSPRSTCPTAHSQQRLATQREYIQRQIRLMFIYPLVYVLMWLFPFVYHCMNYMEKYAMHPLHWLTLANTICITLMGAVDCFVFSVRERPWRHIPTTDGRFWTSLLCLRTKDVVTPRRFVARESDVGGLRLDDEPIINPDASPETPAAPTWADGGRFSRVKNMIPASRVRHSVAVRMSGGSSEQHKADRIIARARLEYEKEDRRREERRKDEWRKANPAKSEASVGIGGGGRVSKEEHELEKMEENTESGSQMEEVDSYDGAVESEEVDPLEVVVEAEEKE